MTRNIGASIFMNKYILLTYLERTILSLIIFGFWRSTLGGDGRALWSLADFNTGLWALRRLLFNWFSAGWYVRTSDILSSIFLSRFWNETVSVPILLFQFLNQHDPLCIHVLLTTVLIAQDECQVFLLLNKFFKPYNLSVCNRSFIRITVTWLYMKVLARIVWIAV